MSPLNRFAASALALSACVVAPAAQLKKSGRPTRIIEIRVEVIERQTEVQVQKALEDAKKMEEVFIDFLAEQYAAHYGDLIDECLKTLEYSSKSEDDKNQICVGQMIDFIETRKAFKDFPDSIREGVKEKIWKLYGL